MLLRVPSCCAAITLAGLAMALGVQQASPQTAAALPTWAKPDLEAGEYIARVDTCGKYDFLVTTGLTDGPAGGREIRVRAFGDAMSTREVARWLESDLAAPGDVIRVDGRIDLVDAATALEAVRPSVPPGATVQRITFPEQERIATGQLVEWNQPDAIDVRVQTSPDGNEQIWRVTSAPSGLVAARYR